MRARHEYGALSASNARAITWVTAFTLIACASESDDPQEKGPTTIESRIYLADVRAEDGQPPEEADEPLNQFVGMPLVAPDGHTITLAEFERAQGTADVTCTSDGTEVALAFDDLIADGVYSIWVVTFNAPFDGETEDQIEGFGAAGKGDGSNNSFVASSSGKGEITVLTKPGELSVVGAVGACAPEDEVDWALFVIFHMDGMTHGPTPGPHETGVTQLLFHAGG